MTTALDVETQVLDYVRQYGKFQSFDSFSNYIWTSLGTPDYVNGYDTYKVSLFIQGDLKHREASLLVITC